MKNVGNYPSLRWISGKRLSNAILNVTRLHDHLQTNHSVDWTKQNVLCLTVVYKHSDSVYCFYYYHVFTL